MNPFTPGSWLVWKKEPAESRHQARLQGEGGRGEKKEWKKEKQSAAVQLTIKLELLTAWFAYIWRTPLMNCNLHIQSVR